MKVNCFGIGGLMMMVVFFIIFSLWLCCSCPLWRHFPFSETPHNHV